MSFAHFCRKTNSCLHFCFLPSPVDEKEVAELKKKEAARSKIKKLKKKEASKKLKTEKVEKKEADRSNHPLLQHEHDLYEECQNFRQRWRLVALVREADTEAEETARKEKLEVNFNTIVAIFISFIVNIVVIFIIDNTIITIATRRH